MAVVVPNRSCLYWTWLWATDCITLLIWFIFYSCYYTYLTSHQRGYSCAYDIVLQHYCSPHRVVSDTLTLAVPCPSPPEVRLAPCK